MPEWRATSWTWLGWLAAVGTAAGALACGAMDRVPGHLFDGRTPRERYEERLELVGLSATALVRDWAVAGQRALPEAPRVNVPHAEEGYLVPAEPVALAVRVAVRRGQEVRFELVLAGDSTTTVFMDAWEVTGDTAAPFRRIADGDSGARSLALAPRRDMDLILRAQPELLRGGRFRLRVDVGPTLAFPVRGAREQDVWSPFGAPRDGGARRHHGIDIFAPRGTVALAAAAGRVSRVETSRLGGNVVWVRDEQGHALYYAHLDQQHVREGDRVTPGDTIGFVGNTGNARTSRPHLHFGVYARGEGPVDPWWFVHRPRGVLPRLAADTALLGLLGRTRDEETTLRTAPRTGSDTLRPLPGLTPVRVLAATGGWYRVRLPDGVTGYLEARRVERAREGVARQVVAVSGAVLSRPAMTTAGVLAETRPGDSVSVLGRFGEYRLVRTAAGVEGWVMMECGPATSSCN